MKGFMHTQLHGDGLGEERRQNAPYPREVDGHGTEKSATQGYHNTERHARGVTASGVVSRVSSRQPMTMRWGSTTQRLVWLKGNGHNGAPPKISCAPWLRRKSAWRNKNFREAPVAQRCTPSGTHDCTGGVGAWWSERGRGKGNGATKQDWATNRGVHYRTSQYTANHDGARMATFVSHGDEGH